MKYYKVEEIELDRFKLIGIFTVFPTVFFLFGLLTSFLDNDFYRIFKLYAQILISPTILITDFLKVGGVSATFFNASIIGFINIIMIWRCKLKFNGLLIAAFITLLGFSFFGKNIFNIFPIYLGGYLYAKYQNIKFKDIFVPVAFGTALSPIISEISFSGMLEGYLGILVGIVVGIFIGFIIVPLSSHMLRFHEGFNLYNIGFTAGIIGTVLTSILRNLNIDISPVNIIYDNDTNLIIGLFIFLFLYLIIVGFIINNFKFKNFPQILQLKGRIVNDFTHSVGYGITFINMGLMGLICLLYVIMINGSVNGPVIAGIFTVCGFSAFGKNIYNCLPIVLGVIMSALLFGYKLSSIGILIAVLFSTTLAPMAGNFGIFWGITAGFLHLVLVTQIGVIHGGINLYNNGFAGGIVAGFLIPVIRSFRKE